MPDGMLNLQKYQRRMLKIPLNQYFCAPSGCSTARLVRYVRDVEVAGSNPVIPTDESNPKVAFILFRLCGLPSSFICHHRKVAFLPTFWSSRMLSAEIEINGYLRAAILIFWRMARIQLQDMIQTDICIIGAGPVGLFAVFEAGLLKMRCHVVDVLPQVGGQLSEIYPKKPIYDIPGYPEVNAQQLVDNLMKQIAPFHPTFTLGEKVKMVARLDDGSFDLTTSEDTVVRCKAIVIAAGLGSFEPRKPAIDGLDTYEGKDKGLLYMIRDPEIFRGKRVVLAGGGDSALDWTIFLANVVGKLTLIHRNETFRGAPDSARKYLPLHVKEK